MTAPDGAHHRSRQAPPPNEGLYATSTVEDWWAPQGRFRVLRHLNPLRLAYLERAARGLAGKRVLDVGCGGGLLAEAMALRGAHVTGLDVAEAALSAATAHAPAGLALEYVHATLAEYLDTQAGASGSFDVVACMELLEHVPDPAALVRDCARAAAAGAVVVFATLNRSPTAYLAAIVGAEYLAGLVPMGTHEYQRFLRPAELAGLARVAGLSVMEVRGMAYIPLLRRAFLVARPSVNYLLCARRPAGQERSARAAGLP